MAWDDTHQTAADPDNPDANEQITATEWNNHVTEGHWPADELNLGVDGGDPVLTDPQNADEIVARYDRSAGEWVVEGIDVERLHNIEYVSPGDPIQDAVDAADPGGTVYFLSGEHAVSSTVDIGGITDVTIGGDGDAVVKAADNLEDQMFNNLSSGTVDRVTFKNITFDGNYLNQNHSNTNAAYIVGGISDANQMRFVNLTVQNTSNNAFVVNDGGGHRVIGCEFDNIGHPDSGSTANAVNFFNSSDGHLIAHNEFGRATDNALYTRNQGTVVYANTFRECRVYLFDADSDNQFYLNNHIVGVPTEPVTGTVGVGSAYFRMEVGNNANVHIRNNVLSGVDAAYNSFFEAENTSVTGLEHINICDNIIRGGGNLVRGIATQAPMQNCRIDGNLVQGTTRHGLILDGIQTGSVSGNVVYNTNTDDNDFSWALRAGRGSSVPFENVVVRGNAVIDDRGTTLHYIGLEVESNGAWVNVGDNIVRGATDGVRNIETGVTNLVANGLGYNAGDPSTTGDWNGNGIEGLTVRDTTNSNTYIYNNGTWSQIASA